jgi:glycosyltransferase involved in cell wall biosynthesis
MPLPFVSVLIDTYNHERFIAEAVESVLAQDFPAANREILVVDDGSTDRTPEILRKYEPQIRVLRKANGGQASAFNHGIPACRGELIAFLDGDDWWAPGKLKRVVEVATAEADIGIIGHGIVNVRQGASSMQESLLDGFRFQANTLDGALKLRRRGAFLGTSRMTIRRNLLERIGPVPESIRIQADEYLFTLAAVLGGARILPDALTYYRLHDANLFLLTGNDRAKLLSKQQALDALAKSLELKLELCSVPVGVRRAITALSRASADQLRLALQGGWCWETVRTEWNLYRISHPEASLANGAFRLASLLPALALPPRVYYSARHSIANSELYRRARRRLLATPEMTHVQKNTTP